VVILNVRNGPIFLKSTLKDVEGHGDAKGTFRENKRPKR